MIYIVQNIVPILLATLAALIVGQGYRALIARPGRPATPSPGFLPIAALAQAWLCAILAGALILAPPRGSAWTMAIGSAVIIWIGFVVPATLVTLLGRGVRLGAAMVDCGYWLAVMLTQAAVLRAIGLVHP